MIEKDYHSDTYLGDCAAANDLDEDNKADDRPAEFDLEQRVYNINKNKRSSLYSDFGDLEIAFVNEDLYFLNKDEDINFESDTDNDDSGNYEEFRCEDHKELEDEMFAELEVELGDVTVPTKCAPTVENDDLSQNGDTADEDDDDDEEEDESVTPRQEVKHSESNQAVTEIEETAGLAHEADTAVDKIIVHDDDVTVGEAEPEYQECETGHEQRTPSNIVSAVDSNSSNDINSEQKLYCNEVRECPENENDLSTKTNTKDDEVNSEEVKCETDYLPSNDVEPVATNKDCAKETLTNASCHGDDIEANVCDGSNTEATSNIAVNCDNEELELKIDGNNSHALDSVEASEAPAVVNHDDTFDDNVVDQEDHAVPRDVHGTDDDHDNDVGESRWEENVSAETGQELTTDKPEMDHSENISHRHCSQVTCYYLNLRQPTTVMPSLLQTIHCKFVQKQYCKRVYVCKYLSCLLSLSLVHLNGLETQGKLIFNAEHNSQ